MLRFIWLTVLAWLIWRWLDRWLAGRNPPPAARHEPNRYDVPPAQPPAEALVRCDRCGVRVPASQLAAVRANCRQCVPL